MEVKALRLISYPCQDKSNFLCSRKCFRSDGVDLEFLFFKKPFGHREPKTPAHYKNWLVHGGHRTTIWGVDPGKIDIFVAVDGSSTNPHRVRKTSSKEYYDLCGFNQATNKQRRWMADHERARQLIDRMPSVKTADLGTLRAATCIGSTILQKSAPITTKTNVSEF